jgi:hypothetical protein
VYSGATVTNGLDGIESWAGVWDGSVTGDMDGIYVEADISGGTVDNRYGIFIAAGDGAPTGSDYGIYQESTTAQNYFGGTLQVGSASTFVDLTTTGAQFTTTQIATTSAGEAVDNYINNYNTYTGLYMRPNGTNGGDPIAIDTYASSPIFYVKGSGNVGIGTNAPGNPLTVYGTAQSAPTIAANNTQDPYQIMFSNTLGFVMGGGSGSPYPVWLQTYNWSSGSTTYPLALNPLGGGVGIGTTNPTTTLYVKGTATVTGAVTLSGLSAAATGQYTVCINTTSGALSYYGSHACTDSSDIRVKRDIVNLTDDDGLDAIMKLRPVSFRWKDTKQDKRDGKQIGLIAQEVETVFPAVGITSVNGDATLDLGGGKTEKVDAVHAVSYDRLTVPLVKAVQQQQAEIDSLKAANDNLRAANDNQAQQLKALDDRIEKLEAAHH